MSKVDHSPGRPIFYSGPYAWEIKRITVRNYERRCASSAVQYGPLPSVVQNVQGIVCPESE
jgi:hypothetical protein